MVVTEFFILHISNTFIIQKLFRCLVIQFEDFSDLVFLRPKENTQNLDIFSDR